MGYIKGQAAVEFLVTYGWAFILILVMGSGLAYFGVLDSNKYLPDTCLFTPPFGACANFASGYWDDYNYYYFMELKNNFGESISITNITGMILSQTQCDELLLEGYNFPPPNPADTYYSIYLTNGSITNPGIPYGTHVWKSGETVNFIVICGNYNPVLGKPAIVKMKITFSYIPVGKSYVKQFSGDIRASMKQVSSWF